MFYYEIPWFYQDFKGEKKPVLFKYALSSRSENTGPDTRGHAKFSK